MSFKTISNCFLFFLFILSVNMTGQDAYEKGYIVTLEKDTLYGSVKDRKPDPFGGLFKKIKFKGERGKSKYGPKEILAYKKGGSFFESLWVEDSGRLFDQNYTSIEGSGRPVFLKVVEKGFLTYYHWEFEEEDSSYIDYIAYFKKEDNPNLIRVSQGLFGLRRKALTSFFRDCQPLAQDIQNKKLKSGVEIARFYNAWKEKN